MISALLFFLLLQSPSKEPRDVSPRSTVTVTGQETFAELLTKLNQTGNVVTDQRDEYQRQQTVAVKLAAGTYTFWQTLDLLSTAAELEFTTSIEGVKLRTRTGVTKPIVAYDGPWRARLVRRSVLAYENPALDRLLIQVELMLEPRMVPVSATLNANAPPHPRPLSLQGRGEKYQFDGEPTKLIEVRLPRPPRQQTTIDKLELNGDAWLSTGRLKMSIPMRVQANAELEGTRFSITQIFNNPNTTISTELLYPEGSFDWESHQSAMLGSMKLVLRQGNTEQSYRSRQINTDAGRRTTARWQFPKIDGEWQAHLTAPTAPVKLPMKLVFEKVELP